jgi:hypothetical protein
VVVVTVVLASIISALLSPVNAVVVVVVVVVVTVGLLSWLLLSLSSREPGPNGMTPPSSPLPTQPLARHARIYTIIH